MLVNHPFAPAIGGLMVTIFRVAPMNYWQYDFRLIIFAVDSVSAACIPGLKAQGD
jgi:hypothetical protein